MASPEPIDRAARLAPWAGGLLLALPVLVASFPPMADLPLHEVSIGLLRHWGDPHFSPPSVYFLNLGHPNQLFSLLVVAVSYAFPVPWASKIVVAASLVALPVAAARFADHVGAPRWTALLVAPLGLGWLFFWGLIQNIVGLVALLALLPTIDRFAVRPTGRGALGMCGAMVLLHFAHQAIQLIACAAVALCSIGSIATPPRLKSNALRAAPVLFGGALAFVANRMAWRISGPRHRGTPPFEWNDPWYKIQTIPGVLFGGYEAYVRDLIFVMAVVPLVLLVADRIRQRDRGPRPLGSRLHGLRFEVLAAMLLAIYLTAPSAVKSTTLVYHRFLPPAWAIFAISGAAGTATTARLLPRALCALLPVASLLVGWPTFVDADRIYSDLDVLMPKIEESSAVMALNFGPDPPARLWNPVVAMGHVVAQKGGRSLFDYSQSPTSPVSMRSKKQWVESINRMEKQPYAMIPSWDFTRYRYLLACTSERSLGVALALAMRNEAVLVGTQGDWYLFESRLPLAPIDARDAWPPRPPPPTLGKGLETVSRELQMIERAGLVAAQ